MSKYVDAEEFMSEFVNEFWNVEISFSSVDDIIEKLVKKAGDVAPVIHAKWIPVTNSRGGHECSLCHYYAPSFKTGDEWLSDYCPNCGARMDEDNNNDKN